MIAERVSDFLREMRIRRMARQLKRLCRQGRFRTTDPEAVEIGDRFKREILSRSPAQVARMVRERPLYRRAM